MSHNKLDEAEARRRLEVIKRNGGNVCASARELGMSKSALQSTVSRYGSTIILAETRAAELGYVIPTTPRSPLDAWNSHTEAFQQELAASSESEHVIRRPKGPFVVFHATDEHVDDNSSMLKQVEADITSAHAMGAIMVHGGDLLNNWPLAGKLAKMWAEQKCSLPDALLRAQHFIEIFKPDFWTDGNQEEMNPYIMQMLHGWLPKKCKRGYWTVRWTVEASGGRPIKFAASHKFQKGSSWFHPHHGVLREMLEAELADVYMEGHLHVSGTLYRYLPERGCEALAVSSSGYKVMDKYAARISRGGVVPKIKGRSHWIVCDPMADFDGRLAHAFDCPKQAEAFLNGLQNLRAA